MYYDYTKCDIKINAFINKGSYLSKINILCSYEVRHLLKSLKNNDNLPVLTLKQIIRKRLVTPYHSPLFLSHDHSHACCHPKTFIPIFKS